MRIVQIAIQMYGGELYGLSNDGRLFKLNDHPAAKPLWVELKISEYKNADGVLVPYQPGVSATESFEISPSEPED